MEDQRPSPLEWEIFGSILPLIKETWILMWILGPLTIVSTELEIGYAGEQPHFDDVVPVAREHVLTSAETCFTCARCRREG